MEQHSCDHERENQKCIFLRAILLLLLKLVCMHLAQNTRLRRMVILSTPHLLQSLNNLIEAYGELELFDN